MLSVHGLCVRVGGYIVVSQISLEIAPGKVLAVMGPNGAGKSTLLKALCGELSPHRGEIMMNGRRLADWAPREQALMRAVLPQNSTLAFPLSVMDVVLLGRSPHHGARNAARNESIAREVMRVTGTESLHKRLYPTLSGGERQRVQLARVLAQIWEPVTSVSRYLLLDEPGAALDIAHQHAILSIARRFANERNTGVLIILHDFNLAARYADCIAVLTTGGLKALGPPDEVLNTGLIQEVFRISVTVTQHPANQNQVLVIDCPVQQGARAATRSKSV
ncbi:MAG: heme ABC transporter ATP-binding protein, partial [Methylococcales bacterium]